MTVGQKLRQNQWLTARLPLVLWMAAIFYLSSQPDLPHLGLGWFDFAMSTGAHIFLFGVLALLWLRVLGNRRHALPIALACTLLYAFGDEFHQAFVPGRHMDPLDLFTDAVGAIVALFSATYLRKRTAPATPQPDRLDTSSRPDSPSSLQEIKISPKGRS